MNKHDGKSLPTYAAAYEYNKARRRRVVRYYHLTNLCYVPRKTITFTDTGSCFDLAPKELVEKLILKIGASKSQSNSMAK